MKYTLLFFALIVLNATSFSSIANTQTPIVLPAPANPLKLSNQPSDTTHTWTGIGRIMGPNNASCTASLLDTRIEGAQTSTSPAYVITSHRCLNTSLTGNYIYPGGVQQNTASQGNVYFNKFDNTLSNIKKYAFDHIVWQSDEGTNLAIIELQAPLSTLLADGIQPLKIAANSPPAGTEILMLGIPGFDSLHSTSCTQLASADIITHPWVSTQLLTNQCAPLTRSGFGGPVLNKATNELVSVLVASTHGAKPAEKCLVGSPCELEAGTSVLKPDTHYTRPVSFLNHCFVQGLLDANRPACGLYKLTSVRLNGTHLPPTQIMEILDPIKRLTPEKFELSLTVDAPYFRYKYAHTANECHTAEQYSEIIERTSPHIDFTLNNQTGMHMLCVIGIDSHEDRATYARLQAAKIITIERIKASPAQAPKMTLTTHKNNGAYYAAHWDYTSPFLKRYETKYGPIESTDCASPDEYAETPGLEVRRRDTGPWERIYEHTDHPTDPELILIKRNNTQLTAEHYIKFIYPEDAVFKLCTVMINTEGQRSEPRTDILKPL